MQGFIAINSTGRFLVATIVDKGGFSSGKRVCYEWVDDLHKATILRQSKITAYSISGCAYTSKIEYHNLENQCVSFIPALVQTTRVVTILPFKG